MLERLFALAANGTTVRREILAGCTTFLTMSAILFVNPDILAQAGIDHGAAFVATCLAAAIGSLIMGLLANYPIGQAPGMGINAFFTFGLVKGMGLSWEVALGCVFVSGLLFVLVSVPLTIIVPLLLAVALSKKGLKGAGLFQAIFYIPGLISIAAGALVWRMVFNSQFGLLNTTFHTDINWLGKNPYAWITIFVLVLWAGIGGNLVIYRSALSGVDESLYEAAKVDGAGPVRIFFSITLPEIKLHLKATAFQLKVWESLLKIPLGQLSSYGEIAAEIGQPKAGRAVGTAIGSNPVAFLIPCHRVIRATGIIGGYKWGALRKTAIIGWEGAKAHESA